MPTAPTSEKGVTNLSPGLNLPGWRILGSGVVDDVERAPNLKWPASVRETYPEMRNDSQVEALFYATTLPIRRYRWVLDPNGADEAIVAKLSADYGLPLKGSEPQPVARTRNRFSFGEHLRLLLQALLSGHYIFEQYGEIGPDGLWHVRKLAPRAPHTIDTFDVASDGGLRAIRQTIGKDGRPPDLIPVESLIAYVWDAEPGRWTGRSMLRSIYREWVAKDRLIRVDQMKHERNGMGVPVAKATDKDVSPQQLKAAQQVAAAWMVGEHASASMPYGVDIELKGVQGSVPDTLASIQRHDEAMSRRWLGMLIQLGQTETGSRALGSEFSDLIEMGRDAIADWVCDVFSEHQLEDDVDWNFGEQVEYVPRLAYEKPEDSQQIAPPQPPGPIGAPAPAPAPVATDRRPLRFTGGGGKRLYGSLQTALATPAARGREAFDHEVRAAADFEGLDADWRSALSRLLDGWEDVTATEIGELATQVQVATSLEELAGVQAAVSGHELLAGLMAETTRSGMNRALAEAAAQGVMVDPPDLAATDAVLDQRARAIATLLSRSLSEAAGRKAVSLAAGGTTNEELATGVRTHLEGLSTAYLQDQLGGALTAAQNAGRAAAFEVAGMEREPTFYASELMDQSTCEACAEIDGTELANLDDVRATYPTGYANCLGGPRCRGTAVAVYEEA